MIGRHPRWGERVDGRGARSLQAADAVLRAPLPLSRRIGFVAVDGGCGTSSTAAHVATTYAVRRSGAVLAVDAGPGPAGLFWHTATRPEPRAEAAGVDAAAVRAHARTTRDAVLGLATTGAGLHLLDLRGPDLVSPDLRSWSAAVRPSGRFFDVVVTDFGVRRPGEDLLEVASTCHVLVVVGRADRVPAGRAAATADLLAGRPDGPAVALVLVDVGRTSDRCAAALADGLPVPVLTVRHDRARAEAPGLRRLARRTRLDLVRVSATLLSRSEQRPGAGSGPVLEVA